MRNYYISLDIYKGCPKIHARFEFCAICKVLKIVKNGKLLFIVEEYFKNNEGFSNRILFRDEARFHVFD